MRVSSARRAIIVLLLLGGAAGSAARAQCEPVWSSLGGHASVHPRALSVYDEDGPGPGAAAMFVGGGLGDIRIIARWDGWEASAVGDGPHESSYGLEHFEPLPEAAGMLPAGLYAGGDVDTLGGVSVNDLARWSAGQWHDVGSGVGSTPGLAAYLFALEFFDEDDEGPLPPSLLVGGKFEFAGGVRAEALARWDGTSWSAVGGGIEALTGRSPTINALAVYDDGRGKALYVAGSFNSAGAKECWNIARWDGEEWEPVGPGLATTVESLCVYDEDGSGPERPALFAGGQFSRVRGGERNTLMRIARWDGSEWSAVGGWRSDGAVLTMTIWDPDGPGPKKDSLYTGGFFNVMPDGSPANQLARWDGEVWSTVGGGIRSTSGFGPSVYSLGVFDEDAPGPNPGGLYVGGLFSHGGDVPAKNIARWGCPLSASRPCYADCDGDGELAFFDFLCFQNLFAAGEAGADCDQSGGLDFFDFLCFQNAFAGGCP